MKMLSIPHYNQLRRIRDSLRKITQLSYNISMTDRTYPLERLKDTQYQDMIDLYLEFYEELVEIEQKIKTDFKK